MFPFPDRRKFQLIVPGWFQGSQEQQAVAAVGTFQVWSRRFANRSLVLRVVVSPISDLWCGGKEIPGVAGGDVE